MLIDLERLLENAEVLLYISEWKLELKVILEHCQYVKLQFDRRLVQRVPDLALEGGSLTRLLEWCSLVHILFELMNLRLGVDDLCSDIVCQSRCHEPVKVGEGYFPGMEAKDGDSYTLTLCVLEEA